MTTCLGKSCSFGLPRVPFVNCCQFMYLVISLLVLRAGCGIWLYRFLIIAYLFTLHSVLGIKLSYIFICILEINQLHVYERASDVAIQSHRQIVIKQVCKRERESGCLWTVQKRICRCNINRTVNYSLLPLGSKDWKTLTVHPAANWYLINFREG